jgi:hypothetical protein
MVECSEHFRMSDCENSVLQEQLMPVYKLHCLTLSDPTSDLVRQYDFAPMSEDVRHGFGCVCLPAVGACPTLFLM